MQDETSKAQKNVLEAICRNAMGLLLLVFYLHLGVSSEVLPDETSLENPEKNLATEIISSDGKTIGKFYKENRTPVPFSRVTQII